MENTVTVTMKNGEYKVARGTKLSEFAKRFENEYVHDIILARRDARVYSRTNPEVPPASLMV